MRRRYARLLTLVLVLELAALCCACSQVVCHHCAHGPRCSICEMVRLGLRTAFLLPEAALVLLARMAFARRRLAAFAPCHTLTLFDQKVQLND